MASNTTVLDQSSEDTKPIDLSKTTKIKQVQKVSRASKYQSPKRNLPVIVLSASLLCALGLAGFFGYHYFSDSQNSVKSSANQANSSGATAAAADYVIKLSSFDYRDLAKNKAAMIAASTPDFAKKYTEMLAALTEIVKNGKGEATATVTNSGIEKITKDSASVVLFVDQQAKNVVSPNGRLQPYRMFVQLKFIDGRWLVDNVETK